MTHNIQSYAAAIVASLFVWHVCYTATVVNRIFVANINMIAFLFQEFSSRHKITRFLFISLGGQYTNKTPRAAAATVISTALRSSHPPTNISATDHSRNITTPCQTQFSLLFYLSHLSVNRSDLTSSYCRAQPLSAASWSMTIDGRNGHYFCVFACVALGQQQL